MASFVLFPIFLLFVARSANAAESLPLSLECDECFNDGGTNCSGSLQPCKNEEKCIAVHSVTNMSTEHTLTESFTRSCEAVANYLTDTFHFNFGDGRTLDFTSQICKDTDPGCYRKLEDDKMIMYENGKSCPKCYRTGYDYCDSDGDVICLGDLLKCTEVNGVITNKESGIKILFAGKGCGNPLVCDLKEKSFRQENYTISFKNIQCSNALSSLRRLVFTLEKKDLGPQVAFFFPCILGIFAVKILSW